MLIDSTICAIVGYLKLHATLPSLTKETKKLVKQLVIAFAIGVIVGIIIWINVVGFLKDSPTVSAIVYAGSLIGTGILFWVLNNSMGLVGVVQDILKKRQEEGLKPRLDITRRIWDRNHPLHSTLFATTRIFSIRVENKGGGKVAEGCNAHITIEGHIDFEDALNWLYRSKDQLFAAPYTYTDNSLRNGIVQERYVRNFVVNINKGTNNAEYVDVLFTDRDDNRIYFLDANRTKLRLGESYNIKITIEANELAEKNIHLILAIPTWEDIQVNKFEVV